VGWRSRAEGRTKPVFRFKERVSDPVPLISCL